MSTRSPKIALSGSVVALLLLAPLPLSAAVVDLTLDPSTVTGGSGDGTIATITLDGPAPAGGQVVDLTSSNTDLAASTPSLVVPEGATTATFTVGTNAFYRPFSGLPFDVTIAAASRGDGTAASALLHVTSQPRPGPFTGGTASTDQQARDGNICGGAFGSGSAGARGILFRCEFEVPGAFSVCRFLQECEFGCQEEQNTIPIGSPITVRDFCRTSPPAPIAVTPDLVVGGGTANGTLLFGEPAPQFSEFQVSSSPPMVSPLGNTPIPQGATSAPFTVRTGEVAVPTFLPLNATLFLSPLFRYDSDFLAIVPAPGAAAPTGPLAVFSVSVAPTTVVGGQSELVIATITLNGVAPSGGALVSLSTNDAAAAVPATVTVGAGRTNAFVSVTTTRVTAPTSVVITATLGGVSRSATLTVNPPSPAVKLLAVSLDPPGVVGGSASSGTVIIDTPAPSGGTSVPLTSSHVIATVPASVTVPAGATRASFTVTTSAVTTRTEVTISGNLNFETLQAFLTVSPTAPTISLSALSVSPTSLVGGSNNRATGTVTLTAAAPSGGANVNVSRDSGSVFVPAWITVPAGATSATFTISTAAVTSSTLATITAGYGATTRTATLTLTPSTLASLTLNPSSVRGGESSTGTVTLSAPAPSGGTVATLSDVGDVTTIPASVTIPAGAVTATFPIATQPVSETFNANIWARVDGVEKQALLIVQPSESTPTPPATGTVSSAPSLISPSNRAVVAQPITFDWSDVTNASTYELQIDSSSTFTAPLTRAEIVSVSQATISGLPAQRLFWRVRGINSAGAPGPFSASRRFDARAQTSTTAASLSGLSVNPSSVVGGTGSQGTVTLTSAAPAGGAVVSLSSSNSAVASMASSVTVPAGATTASFPISTTSVGTNTTVTVSGSFGGVTRSATLTTTASAPSGAVTLTVTASGRSGERVVSSPAGIDVPVGSTRSASFPGSTSITLSVSNGRDAIWSGACSSGGAKARTCRFTITGNASVTGNVQ